MIELSETDRELDVLETFWKRKYFLGRRPSKFLDKKKRRNPTHSFASVVGIRMRKTFYWKNEQVSATFWEPKKKKESPIIFWQTPNRQIIVDFLGFFRRILPISLKIQREVQYVSSRNNFVKAIFWFLCGCFYTFFAWSQRFKSGCFLFKRNKNFWISFES